MIGSLQITIPAGCMNNCSFCVYKQHSSKFMNLRVQNKKGWTGEIERRLRYAANRVDAVMITSHGEPSLNISYIRDIIKLIDRVAPRLAHIELQTSGVGLTEEKLNHLYELGIRVISLSIPALEKNAIADIMQIHPRYDYDPFVLIRLIKSKGFTLRLSIAMTTWFDDYSLEEIMGLLKQEWAPDQVSFKKLYGADNQASKNYEKFVREFTENPENEKLELLALGVWKYDADDFAVVWNDDCMVSSEQKKPRYLILQPDGKLYTRWDSKASLIF